MTAPLRAFCFCLPLFALFAPPALVLWLSGELTSADQLVNYLANNDRPILHGAAYTNATMYVKSRIADSNDPQVLALGSSRVMQFRANCFLPTARFYNAGGMVARLVHFRTVLDRIPAGREPKILLLGIDAYFFNPRFDKLEKDELNGAWLEERMNTFKDGGEVFTANWWQVWADIEADKVDWRELMNLRGLKDKFGLNAVCRNQGFRNDGSYQYGMREQNTSDPKHRDYRFATTLKQVEMGKGRFVYGSTPSAAALWELEALLDDARRRGVNVIGFLPPYPHQVWSAMTSRGKAYDYLWMLPETLRSRFEDRGFEFHDFSDFAWIEADDTEAIDGFHGSEKTYLRVLVAMLRKGSHLNGYADLPSLEAKLKSLATVPVASDAH